jgi:hypothetical protein
MKSALALASSLALVGALSAGAAEITFEDVTDAAGLRAPLAGFLGHGAAWGDIDQDGDPDLFVGGFADRPDAEYAPQEKPPANALFENLGDGTFRLVADSPAATYARTSGAVFADLDNDGWPELIVGNNAKEKAGADRGEIQARATTQRTQLFRNVKGKFADASQESGACPDLLRTARNVMPFDYDGDGLLDLFVVEDRFIKNPRSALYRNLGALKFLEVTKRVGLPEDLFGLGAAVTRLRDGKEMGLFVAHSNRFFLCRDRRFEECASLTKQFAWEPLHNEDWPCGVAFGDLNGDGEPDLVLGIHGEPARNRLFLSERAAGKAQGDPAFRDVTAQAGLPEQWPTKVPHVEMQDFDNDGWLDLYFSTGWLGDDGTITPLVYRNLGCEAGGVPTFKGPTQPPNSKAVYFPAGPSADYDGDGRIDLLLVNWFEGNHTRLLRNTTDGGNWLRVVVRGSVLAKTPGDGIGMVVEIPGVGKREIATGFGYASGQVPMAHFGLGARESVEAVTLGNGDGGGLVRTNVEINRVITFNAE